MIWVALNRGYMRIYGSGSDRSARNIGLYLYSTVKFVSLSLSLSTTDCSLGVASQFINIKSSVH